MHFVYAWQAIILHYMEASRGLRGAQKSSGIKHLALKLFKVDALRSGPEAQPTCKS